MANMKILTVENCPDSTFKLSTVSKGTIEVHDNFNSQLNTIMNRYESVSTSLKTLSNQMTSDANKYKKSLDSKKITGLKNLATAMKKQATACDSRKKAMNTSAKKDTEALKAAAKAKAWAAAIDAILADKTLSASARAAIANLKNYL